MKRFLFISFSLLINLSFSQSREIKDLQNQIPQWEQYTFNQFVLDMDRRFLIGYRKDGIVSGVIPDWNEYSNLRPYRIIFTPILKNGEYGGTQTLFENVRVKYTKEEYEEYVNQKIEDVKKSIDAQLNKEREIRIRREKMKELERKKDEFISSQTSEINRMSSESSIFFDSIIQSVQDRFKEIILLKSDLQQTQSFLLKYYQILYGSQFNYQENLSTEQFNLLNKKYLLMPFEKGFDKFQFNSNHDNRYIIIEGHKTLPHEKGLRINLSDIKFPEVILSSNNFNHRSVVNSYLDQYNGDVLFEFSLFYDLIDRSNRLLNKYLRIKDVQTSITSSINHWKIHQLKELEREVFNFKIDSINSEIKELSELQRIITLYESELTKTGFLDKNMSKSDKLIHLMDLSNKYDQFSKFYTDQIVPLTIDLIELITYNGKVAYPKKIDKVIKELEKNLGLSQIQLSDYDIIIDLSLNGFSIDRKIKLANDFINRLDSNPMGFPLNDIRNLKIFK